MLCTTLVEGNSKEIIQQWLKEFENFMRYIMILSETLGGSSVKNEADQIYNQKVQHKFSNVITFGFAFLFHQIHCTNIQQKQSPVQSNKPIKLQINPITKMTPNSNTSRSSSPKDYQAINRMFALTLKNLVIYFVNIVDYKDLCKGIPSASSKSNRRSSTAGTSSGAENPSAVLQIFSKIFVNKFSDQQQSQLITLEDIKRYKATNFEDFPEYFSHEDWKVTFFHNEEINEILSAQMSPQMIEELFLTRR